MSRKAFVRPAHREVLAVLERLNGAFLTRAECYFGGGTRIVLELGEYRESKDIDFLCASRDGYRLARETVSEKSLGPIVTSEVSLAREVRADQYGLRTFLEYEATRIKFEIIREARIDLEGEKTSFLSVPCLTRRHAFAEKFLANADRGLDASTLSRDAVDLAFMIEGWSAADAAEGLAIAKGAYGDAVERELAAVVRKLREDRTYRNRCIEGLALTDAKALVAGLETLSRGIAIKPRTKRATSRSAN
jgi:hypothetical protein